MCVQSDLYSGRFLLGWLAAPLIFDCTRVCCCLFFFEGRQSWLGGLVSLAWWLGWFLLLSVLWCSWISMPELRATGLDATQRVETKKNRTPGNAENVFPATARSV